MNPFQEMSVFKAVVEAGSFVGAADQLGLSKSVASRLVAELEARLGVRLLHRTTRKQSLTPEGEIFYTRCQSVLADLQEAEAELTSHTAHARGLLKINVPVSYGVKHLAPLWGDFMARNPQVSLEVTLSDRIVDLVEEGYDLAVRIGRLGDSRLIARPLSFTRLVVCASPRYWRQQGTPRIPHDLMQHAVLSYTLSSSGDRWAFEGPQGGVEVKVHPRMHSNSGDTLLQAALQHQGVIRQPEFLVREALASGQLKEVLSDYPSPALGIHAVYPSRKHVSPKVRVLIDFLVEALAEPAPVKSRRTGRV